MIEDPGSLEGIWRGNMENSETAIAIENKQRQAYFIAKRMLPEGTIRKLLLASNTNDILTRFVTRG